MSLSTTRPTEKKKTSSLDELKAEIQGNKNVVKKRINVDVPESYHMDVFIYARKKKMNLTELVTLSLNEYMSNNPLT